MRLDLTADGEDDVPITGSEQDQRQTVGLSRHWLAHPRNLRLTTRPRPPRNPDGSRPTMFNRISRSCSMPSIVFSFSYDVDILAEKIVNDSLFPLFRKLHPEKSGWDLSLVSTFRSPHFRFQ